MTAEQRAKVFKALSDGTRVAIVDTLVKHGPQCGTELSECLGISVALVSHHWEVLVEAGLMVKERVGQARYCSLDLEKLREATEGWGSAMGAPLGGGTTTPKAKASKAKANANANANAPARTKRPAKKKSAAPTKKAVAKKAAR